MPQLPTIEVSNDGQNWQKLSNATLTAGFTWIRTTVSLNDKTKEQIQAAIIKMNQDRQKMGLSDIHRVEYSTDVGFSWSSLGYGSDLISKTINLIHNPTKNNNYEVRVLSVIKPEATNKETYQALDAPGRSICDSFVRLQTDGSYNWRTSGLDGNTVSTVTQEVIYKLSIPNRNSVTWTRWTGPISEFPDSRIPVDQLSIAANWGHVYAVEPSKNFSKSIATLMGSPLAHKLQFTFDSNWVLLKSARLYDKESDAIFHGIDKIGLLGDKYVIGEEFKYKLGSEFFIRTSDVMEVAERVTILHGFMSSSSSIDLHALGIANDLKENKLYRDILKDALENSANSDDLSKAIGSSLDYYNKMRLSMSELASTIKQANAKLEEMISNEARVTN